MKFLPQKYRESRTDWFAKRCISWHISVFYRRVNGLLEWQGLIHVIHSCSQGSPEVVAIMQDVLKTLKLQHGDKRNEGICQARQRRSLSFIMYDPSVSSHCRIHWCPVIGIHFSDPQGGKGAADRLAAKCKGNVSVYINEDNDVCTGSHFQENSSFPGRNRRSESSCNWQHGGFVIDDARTIPGVSKLNNFKFNPESITAWCAYGIGSGKDIRLEKQSSGKC